MWLANRIGRRMSLIVASILVFIGIAMQAAALGYIASLYVGRFVAGVAIGIASSVNPLYVSENAPRGIRGATHRRLSIKHRHRFHCMSNDFHDIHMEAQFLIIFLARVLD